MKIHPISDLHIESGPYTFQNLDCDIIMAAGDIAEGIAGVELLRTLDKPVVYVPGNHEYYSNRTPVDMADRLEEIRAAAVGTNVHVLSNDAVVIDGVRFLGTTLWSSFGDLHPDLIQNAINEMRDYTCISAKKWFCVPENQQRYRRLYRHAMASHKIPFHSDEADDIEKMEHFIDVDIARGHFTPFVTYTLHRQALAWLEERLRESFAGETVIVTHHHPNFESLRRTGVDANLIDDSRNWQRRRDRDLARIGAYASDLDKLLSRHKSDIALWICGHLHHHLDYMHKGVRIVCNPRGHAVTPLSAESKMAFALFARGISDREIDESQQEHAKNPNRGDTENFKQDFVIDLADGLRPCIADEVETVLQRLLSLHENIKTLAGALPKADSVAECALFESIARQADHFEKLAAGLISSLADNVLQDQPSGLSPLPGTTVLWFSNDFLQPGEGTKSRINDVIETQAEWLASMPTLLNVVAVEERCAKRRLILLLRKIRQCVARDVRAEMPLSFLGKWRHVPLFQNVVLHLRALTKTEYAILTQLVDNVSNERPHETTFIVEIAMPGTGHEATFNENDALPTDLDLENLWRDHLPLANVRASDIGFIAELDTGDIIERANPEALADALFDAGFLADEVHCGDWRERQDVLGSGQQIAL